MTDAQNAHIVFDRRPARLEAPDLPEFLPFTKMQGAGNDYVYMEEFDAPLPHPPPLAIRVSDRNFGVGADGLVLIGPSDDADFRMRMFNADGSEAEMCGNAARCVGKYVYEHGLTPKTEISLETLSGVRHLRLFVENGQVHSVRVDMGRPRLKPEQIPMNAFGESFINQPVTINGKTVLGTAVSMGNPHLVVAVPDVSSLDFPYLGRKLENHPLFPCRVNAEFVEILSPDRLRMRVWERGAGETLACGTGACACLIACALNGWTGRSATVEVRGGELFIEWTDDDLVFLTGPAVEVFSGKFKVR